MERQLEAYALQRAQLVSASAKIGFQAARESSKNLTGLSNKCEVIEGRIPEIVAGLVAAELQSFLAPRGSTSTSRSEFSVDQKSYRLLVEAQKSCIVLTIRSNRQDGNRLRRRRFQRVETFGRFTSVGVQLPHELVEYESFCLELAQTVTLRVYELLLNYTETFVNQLHSKVAGELYKELSKILPPLLTSKIFFYASVDGLGTYLADDKSRRVAMGTINNLGPELPYSPIEVVARLTTTVLPFEQTSSRIAVTQKDPLLATFSDQLYASTGLNVSEEAIYAAPAILVQPVAHIGERVLVATYPVEVKESVAEPLGNAIGFAQILTRYGDQLRRSISDTRAGSDKRDKDILDHILDYTSLKPGMFGFSIDLGKVLTKARDQFKKRSEL